MQESQDQLEHSCARYKKYDHKFMIECDECKKWLHYERTDLPQHMLSSLAKGCKKYSNSNCFKIK